MIIRTTEIINTCTAGSCPIGQGTIDYELVDAEIILCK